MSTVAGALPGYTRPDLAFERQVNGMTPGGALIRGFTVPGAFWVRVLSLHMILFTDATVGTRIPVAMIVDTPGIQAGTFVTQVPAPAGQVASITNSYFWFPGANSIGALSNIQVSPWPNFYIPSGYSIRVGFTGTTGIGDNITGFDLMLEMIPTGPEAIGVTATRPFDSSKLGLVQSSDFVSSDSSDFLTAPLEFQADALIES